MTGPHASPTSASSPIQPEKEPTIFLHKKLPAKVVRHIFRYLVRDDRQIPALTPENIQDRVPLRNCFDDRKPAVTNIYVQKKRGCDSSRARGILATNRELRKEMQDVMEDPDSGIPMSRGTLSSNGRPIYKLDLMVVQNVGLFPTWINSPPTLVDREKDELSEIHIDIRVVRFQDNLFPATWIEAAQHKEVEGDEDGLHRTRWSFLTIFTLFASDTFQFVPRTDQNTKRRQRLNIDYIEARGTLYPLPSSKSTLQITVRDLDFYPSGVKVPLRRNEKENFRLKHMYVRRGSTLFARNIFELPPSPPEEETVSGDLDAPPPPPERSRLISSYRLLLGLFKVLSVFRGFPLRGEHRYTNTWEDHFSELTIGNTERRRNPSRACTRKRDTAVAQNDGAHGSTPIKLETRPDLFRWYNLRYSDDLKKEWPYAAAATRKPKRRGRPATGSRSKAKRLRRG